MGNAEKEDIHEIISKAVEAAVERSTAKQMKPIQWSFGIACALMTCFVGVMCIPVIDKVFKHESQLENKADTNFLQENFLTKPQYVYLEELQNKANVYIFKDHEQAERTYQELNIQTGKQLDVRWRSARQTN